jgi:hypothetical protein
VIRRSGQMYLELAETIVGGAPDVATGVDYFFHGAAEVLRQATADVFESWTKRIGALLRAPASPRSAPAGWPSW